MGTAGPPQAHVSRGSAWREDRQGFLRIRREREEEVDDLRTDTAKAAVWGTVSGVANIAGLAFAPSSNPAWYFIFGAVGYGLLLPLIAVLHVRHQSVRESGAILATTAGTATITVGIAAGANPDLVVAALFVRGIWWWTVGKMWAETGVMPRWLGLPTMILAVLAIGVALAAAPMGMESATLWMSERLILGLWTLAVSYALWRSR